MNGAYLARGLPAVLIFLRLYLLGLGAFALLWAVKIFPTVWSDPPLERIASKIIEGDPYKINDLLDFMPLINDVEQSTVCRPVSVRSAAAIRLRLAEEAIKTEDQSNIDQTINELIPSIRNSLKCAPADPFLWLVLFWAETTRNGYSARSLHYLRLSYKFGPNEGWVGLKRSYFALSLFEQLPSDVAEKSLDEFVGLVNSYFYQEAAEILAGPGWRLRDKILPRLKKISERHRAAFANEMHRLGYDVEVPGIEKPEARPWR